jgi:hypothetical protein
VEDFQQCASIDRKRRLLNSLATCLRGRAQNPFPRGEIPRTISLICDYGEVMLHHKRAPWEDGRVYVRLPCIPRVFDPPPSLSPPHRLLANCEACMMVHDTQSDGEKEEVCQMWVLGIIARAYSYASHLCLCAVDRSYHDNIWPEVVAGLRVRNEPCLYSRHATTFFARTLLTITSTHCPPTSPLLFASTFALNLFFTLHLTLTSLHLTLASRDSSTL